MSLPSSAIDIIATQILLDTKGVLQSLKNLDSKVESSATRIAMIAKSLQAMANSAGVSIDVMAQKLQKLNAASGGKFGTLGISNTDIERATQVAKGVEGIGKAAEKTKAPIQNIGNNMNSAAKKSKYSIDIIRTAMGVLTAMLVNVVLSAITKFAKDSVKAFMDVEEALWRIHTAEVALSKQGVEISMQGLTDGLAKIKEELKIFSETDLLASMSTFAAGMEQFGFSEEQIVSLTRYAAVLNVVSQSSESLQETTDKMMTALISSQSRSIASINVQFGELAMQLKAVELGYLQAGEAASNLTIEQRAQVKTAIIEDRALEALKEYSKYLETNSAKVKANAASWEDVKTAFGGFMTTIAPGLTGLLDLLTAVINTWKLFGAVWVATVDGIIYSLGSFVEKIREGKNNLVALWEVLTDFPTAWRTIFNFEIRSLFNGMPGDAPEWFKKLIDGALDIPDTPTIVIPIETEGDGVSQDALDALDELGEDLEEVAEKARQARRELEILTEQKYQDILINAEIKVEDVEIEFQQKIEDATRELEQDIAEIHIDAQQKIEDAQREYREDQLRAEMEFQQKLKELREQFMMDLDDALHARDARQVLRLLKQYEFDKKQLYERKALEDKLRKEQLAADLAAIRIEEQRRIEAVQREYAQKLQELEIEKQRELEKINLWKERELEELALWNQREMEEIQRHAEEKMKQLMDAYEAEYGAHKLYQEMINGVIESFTAENIRAMQEMYNFMSSLYAQIGAMYANSMAMIQATQGLVGTPPPTPPPLYQYGGGNYAGGGTVIADKPTVALFGERGLEMATFTPLNRIGSNVNDVFANLSGGGGLGGKISIEMLLSPDLEARVIRNSLSKTAEVIARVSRSKG